MERRSIWAVVAIVAAAAILAIIVAVLLGGGPEPAASPTPIPSVSASASASASAPGSLPAPPSPPASAEAGPPQIAWEAVDALEPDASVHGIAFIGGQWFASGSVGQAPAVWSSDDGLAWTRTEIATTVSGSERADVTDIVDLNGTLVAIGSWGGIESDQFSWAVWRSTDGGATWTEQREEALAMRAITRGGPGLVGAGWDYAGTTPFDSWASLSADGTTWERADSPDLSDSEVHALAAQGDRLLAVGSRSTNGGSVPAAWVSDDSGSTWTLTEPPSLADDGLGLMTDVTLLGNALVAVGRSGEADDAVPSAWISTDGATWQPEVMGASGVANALAQLEGGVVAVGNGPGFDPGPELAWTSRDGVLWAESGPLEAGSEGVRQVADVASGGNLVVATVLCWGEPPCGPTLWRGEVVSGP